MNGRTDWRGGRQWRATLQHAAHQLGACFAVFELGRGGRLLWRGNGSRLNRVYNSEENYNNSTTTL